MTKRKSLLGRGGAALISAIMAFTFVVEASAAPIEESFAYYDTYIKAQDLGKYDFEVETHEIPSHEVLPIIDKSYFPVTVTHFQSEVDNTEPSAIYKSKPVAKVDVVFAVGKFDQQNQMEKYIPTFESRLQSAGNFIDGYVEKVETSTIDIMNQDPSVILKTWEAWKQYPRDPTTTWSYIPEDRSIQDNEYHCHRQCYVDRVYDTKGDFVLQADIVGYRHSWNDFYGLTFRHNKAGKHYAVVYQDVSGSRCGMYDGQLTTGVTLVKATGVDAGKAVATYNCPAWQIGKYWNLRVEMIGSTINVYLDNKKVITWTDSDPYLEGNYGVVSVSHGSGRFKNISLTKGSQKSLGEAISDVSWRDNSTRFVIYCEDEIPKYMQTTDNKDYQYTITKLLNSNAYLINLGNGINKDALNRLLENISNHQELIGTFFNNKPISGAMNQSCDWIIEKVRNMAKPEDWILVNTEILWETEYNDQEHDLPLNFGEHDGTKSSDNSDVKLANLWGVGLTHLYKSEKIFAEKWRYRHFNNYFDNSPVRESFHNVWIEDPVEIFPNPGLYRINYKRRDNPLHPNTNLSDAFDEYRYWSRNYDRIDSTNSNSSNYNLEGGVN